MKSIKRKYTVKEVEDALNYLRAQHKKEVDDLKNLLFNCRTQIEFMNEGYCNGEAESAIEAVKCIDEILNLKKQTI